MKHLASYVKEWLKETEELGFFLFNILLNLCVMDHYSPVMCYWEDPSYWVTIYWNSRHIVLDNGLLNVEESKIEQHNIHLRSGKIIMKEALDNRSGAGSWISLCAPILLSVNIGPRKSSLLLWNRMLANAIFVFNVIF